MLEIPEKPRIPKTAVTRVHRAEAPQEEAEVLRVVRPQAAARQAEAVPAEAAVPETRIPVEHRGAAQETTETRQSRNGRFYGMVSKKVVVQNPTGLHLRPAGVLCKTAMQFKAKITFSFENTSANAKSVLSVLGACVKSGDEIEIFCDGTDEEEALEAMISAVESGLGE